MATAMSRDEFVEHQTVEAERLRAAILTDDTATSSLVALAADPQAWATLYLGALEEAGLLRAEDEAPPVREDPLLMSLMSTLAAGILVGPAGDEIVTSGSAAAFFENVREWYGHDSELIYPGWDNTEAPPPERDEFELNLTLPTHFEAFNTYVPFAECRPDIPEFVQVPPVDFQSFFDPAAEGTGRLASLTGPLVLAASRQPLHQGCRDC